MPTQAGCHEVSNALAPYKSKEWEEPSREGLSAVEKSPTIHPQLPPIKKTLLHMWSTTGKYTGSRAINATHYFHTSLKGHQGANQQLVRVSVTN